MQYRSKRDKELAENWKRVRGEAPAPKAKPPAKPKRTKADTIGTGQGGLSKPKGGVAKPAAKATAKPTDHKSKFAGARDAAHARAKAIQPTAPRSAPAPAAVTSGSSGGSSRPTPPASRPSSGGSSIAKSEPSGTSKIHTYKEHGSDLHVGRYKTLAEHRAAVEKAKGGGSNSSSSTSSSGSNSSSTRRDGTTGVGPVASGEAYARRAGWTERKDGTKGVGPVADGSTYARRVENNPPKKSESAVKDHNKETAQKQADRFLDERRKKNSGQSSVIGS